MQKPHRPHLDLFSYTPSHSAVRVYFAILGRAALTPVILYTRVRAGLSVRVGAYARALRTTAVIATLILGFGGSMLVNFLKPAATSAVTADTINFQARLENSNGAIANDGNYNVEFKLYDVSTGGSALWTEDDIYVDPTHDYRLRLVNGYLTVNLGAVNAFPSTINWSHDLYITMNIGGTTTSISPTSVSTTGWDGEMNPRLKLTAVPYAFSAGQLSNTNGANSTTVDFVTPTGTNTILVPDESGTLCIQNSANCGFALSSGSGAYIQNGTSLQANANFNIQSTATTSPTVQLRLKASQSADLLTLEDSSGNPIAGFNNGGNFYYQSGSYQGVLVQDTLAQNTTYHLPNGGPASDTICTVATCTGGAGGSMTTTGSANHVARFTTSGSAFGDSLLYDNGSFIGLGTTTNTGLLSVVSTGSTLSALYAKGAPSSSASTAVFEAGSSQTGLVLEVKGTSGTLFSVAPNGDVTQSNSGATVTLNGATTVNNSLTVTSSSGLTLGVAGTTSGFLYLANNSNSEYSVLTANAPSNPGNGNATFALPTIDSGNSDTICVLVLNNCNFAAGNGNAFLNGGNTFGTQAILGTNDVYGLTVRTNGSDRLTVDTSGNLNFLQSGTITGAVPATANAAGYNLTLAGGTANGSTTGNAGGSLILQGGAAAGSGNNNGGNVSLSGGAATGSGTTGNLILQGSGGRVAIGNSSPTALLSVGSSSQFTVDTSGNLITRGSVSLGAPSSVTGQINLYNSTNNNVLTIQSAAQTVGSSTVSFPNTGGTNDTVCLLLVGNCTGGAGGSLGGAGTQYYLAKFSTVGGNYISDSLIYDDGTFVGVNTNFTHGTLTVLGAATNENTLFAQALANATMPVAVIRGGATPGSGGNLLELQDSTNTPVATWDAAGNLSTTGNFSQTGAATFSTGTSAVSLNGATSVTGSNNFTVGTGASVFGGTVAVTGTSTFTGLATFNGGVTVANNSNFTQTGTGTFDTGTGAVSLNGNTTIASGKTLTVAGTGAVTFGSLTNGGSGGVVQSSGTGVLSSGTVTVANGGTGATSLTSNGVLFGNGTGAIQATAAAANSILATNGSSVPGLTQTLPTAVQGNITSTGALTAGSIASGFGTITTGNNITTTATIQGGAVTATGVLSGNSLSINSGAFAVSSAGAITAATGITTSGNFSQTGTGTFDTGTGAVSLNGSTSITGTNTLTVGSGLTSLGGGLSVTSGLTTLSGGLTATGAISLNTTGTANTAIGNSTGTFSLASSALNITTAGAISGATTLSLSGTITGATSGNTINGLIISSGALSGITGYVQSSGNFDASGSTGTFKTSSGAVSLNGNTTLASGKTLTLTTLGAATNNTALCYNSSSQVASCNDTFETTNTTDFVRNQSASAQAANFFIQGAASTTTAVIQAAATGTSDILDIKNAAGTSNLVSVTSAGTLNVGNSFISNNGRAVFVQAASSSSSTLTVQNGASQTGGSIEVKDSNGNVVSSFSAGGNELTVGSVAALTGGSSAAAGKVTFSDGSNTSSVAAKTLTLQSATLAANTTITLPAPASGTTATVCYRNDTNCGFALATGANYVQFAPASAQADTTTNNSIFINKTGASGNIIELQSNGTDAFVVNNAGNATFGGTLAVTGTSTFTGLATFNGGVTVANNSNFTQTGTGTFDTGTGAVSLNGNTTIASGKTLTVAGTGATTLGGTLAVTGTSTLTGLATFNGGVTISGTNTLTTGTGTVTIGSLTNGGAGGVVQSSATGVLSSGTVTVANGGTGTTTLTANGILYGNGTSAIQATAAAANSILATDGSNVPGLTQTLPTAVQGNITSTGALAAGSIASGFGVISTGNNITTTAAVQGGTVTATGLLAGNSLSINSGAFAVSSAGAITAATGITTNGNVSQTGTGTFDTGSGAVSLNGNTTITGTKTLTVGTGLTSLGGGLSVTAGLTTLSGGVTATGAINLNTTGTANTAIGNSTGTFALTSSALNITAAGALSGVTTISMSGAITAATSGNTINGLIINAGALSGVTGFTQGSGNFDASGSTGTFQTSTGAVSLNGNTTLATGKTLTLNTLGAATNNTALCYNSSSQVAACSNAFAIAPTTGGYIYQVPGTTADNTIAPTANSVVALSVKGTTGTAAHVLDIYDSTATPALQAYFDATGSLNVSQIIQPTTNNAVDLGSTSARFRTGYFGTSINVGGTALSSTQLSFTGAGTVQSATNSNLTIQSQGTGALTLQSGNGTVSLGTSTDLTATGALTIKSGGTSALALDTSGAAALNVGATNANAVSISRTGVTTTVNGALAVTQASTFTGQGTFNGGIVVGNNSSFDQSGSTGTFKTGTGAVSLNGDTTVATGKNFTVTSGTTNITGATNINTSGTASTAIGNATSTFSLTSNALTVTTAGAIGGVSGYTQLSGNFNASGSAGTFDTTTGNVGLNGNTTVATGKSLTVNGGATSLTGNSAGSGVALAVIAGAVSNVGLLVQGQSSQTADLLQLTDNSGNVNAKFNSNGNVLTLGRIAATGTVTQGTLVFSDGTTSNHSLTLQTTGTYTNDITALLPMPTTGTTGTICYQNDSACGFALSGGSGVFVQFTPNVAQVDSTTNNSIFINKTGASGNIIELQSNGVDAFVVNNSGNTTVAGTLSVTGTSTFTGAATFNGGVTVASNSNFSQTGTGTFDTGSGAVSLNGNTTITGTKTLTVGTGLTSLGGGLSVTAGLTTLSGGLTTTGATSINTTGTANTAIGNATGTFTLDSSALDVSNSGALSGITTISMSGAITAATTSNTINGLIINAGALSGITGFTQGSGNFDASGSTGTFKTSTGAVTLGGNTTLASGKTLTLTTLGAATNNSALCYNSSSQVATCNNTFAVAPTTGGYIYQVPTTTADNTIAPTANSVVALTVKGTTGTAARVLEIYNSSATPTLQAYFDASGSLNVSQLIQPTSNNAVDLGTSSAAFRTGYFGTGVNVAGTTLSGSALQFATGATRSLSIAQETGTNTGDQLTISAGQGGSGGAAGGLLALNGGAATGTNLNGGNVTIDGGAKTGSGTIGSVAIQGGGGATTIGGATTVTGLATFNGSIVIGNNSNFDQSGSTGTFKTGTGAVSLNGSVTIASGKLLTITSLGSATNNTALCYNSSSQVASCNNSFATAPTTGNYLFQVPATTADNTVAPTANSVVALTLKGTTGTAAHVLDVYNSNAVPTLQAYFDASGSLNVSQLIQPTSTNSIDLGTSSSTFRTGYFGTSVNVGGSTLTSSALQFVSGGARTINIAQESGSTTGDQLTIAGGQGGSGGASGGVLALQGGAGAGTNQSGGNITIDGGAATGSGSKGAVILQNGGGQVRVGSVTTPIAVNQLETAGNANNIVGLALHNANNTGTQAGAGVTVYSDNAGASSNYALLGATNSNYSLFPILSGKAFLTNGSGTSGLVIGSVNANSPIIFANNGSETARISSSGNLLLGNSSGTNLLSVGSASQFTVDSSGNVVLGSAAGFDQSGSTGTFKSGTGAVSLNGNVTIATSKTLTINTLGSATNNSALCYNSSSQVASCSNTFAIAPTTGSYVKTNPATTAENTIVAPATAGVVALTVKGNATANAHVIDIYDSASTPAVQAYFDANGSLNVGQLIQPTSNNAIDLGTSSTNFRTGYFGTSVYVAGTTLTSNTLGFVGAGTVQSANNTNLDVKSQGTGVLTLQSGTNTINIGGTNPTIASTGTNTLTVTTGGAAQLNLGTTNVTAVSLGRSGVTTTNNGAFTAAQLLTAQLGMTVTGAAVSLNDSSNFNTSINTGSSTGNVTIGNANASSGTSIILQSGTAVSATISNTSTAFVGLVTTSRTITATSGNSYGLSTTVTASPSSAPAAATNYIGLGGTSNASGTNVNANTQVIGVNGVAGNNSTTNTLGQASGVVAQVNSGNNITAAYGLQSNVINTGTGTFTSAYGASIASPSFTSSGAIGTAYGLQIQDQKVSGVTGTGYGIYQTGASDVNVFSGNVAIGYTTPPTSLSNPLSVGTTGQFSVSSTGVVTFNPANSTSTTFVCQTSHQLADCDPSILSPSGTNFILNQTSAQSAANFNVFATSGVAGVLRGASGQDIAQFQNNGTGAVVAKIDSTGKLTATGITSTGAAVSLNDNSNFNTSINTGTSTGTISIGNSASTGFTVESGSTANLFNGATAHTIQIATGAAAQAVTIGSTNASSTLALQAGSSLTLSGPTTINGGSSTSNTTIGNASAGAFSLLSAQNSSISTGATHTLQVTSSNFNVTTAGAVTASTYNALTLAAASDGFTVAGGSTTSRTLTVTAADITIGSTIKPTSTGALTVQSNGSSTLTLDAGGPSTVEIGRTNASGVNIGKSGTTTTNYGALTSQQLITSQAGITSTGAAVSLNDSSNFNTSINGGTSTGAITIGNSALTGFTVESGSTANLFNGATAHTVQIATGAAAQAVTIGSTNASSTLALQGGSSVTITGPTTINGGSSTSATTIGNAAAGAFSLLSGQNSSISTGATHTLQVTSSNFNVTTGGAVTASTYNALTLTAAADGFTVAGGSTSSRTLTVTGANITVGSTITPTSAGSLAVQSNGANTLTLDTGGANSIQIGTSNANSVSIGNSANNSSIAINGGTGAIGLGTDGFARTISIGTGAATQTVNIGSTNSGVTTLQSAGGILVKGASNIFDNTPGATATSSLVRFGPNAIASGSTSGTYLGINQTTGATADFLNFQVNGAFKLKVDSTGLLNASTGYAVGANTGGSYSCSAGQILSGANYVGGIVISGGTCSSTTGFVTLQNAYDNSATAVPQITLNSSYGGVRIYDGGTAVTGDLFLVANNNGTTKYFNVTSSSINTAGVLNVNGTGDTTIAGKLLLTNTTYSLLASGPVVVTGANGVLKVGTSNQFQVDSSGAVSTTNSLSVGTSGGANPQYLSVDNAGRATYTYNGSSNADIASFVINNKNAGGTTATLNAQTVSLSGVTNATGTNITNGINFTSIGSTPITGNTFRGLFFGTGYNDILNYAGTQLISGTGKLQNAAIDSTVNYSNLTQVGALVSGSIAGGFGDIIQTGASRIQTAASIKGDSLGIGTAGFTQFTVNNSGDVVAKGSLTQGNSGQLVIDNTGNYTSSGSLFLTGTGASGQQLKVTGAPTASTTQPLVQFGAALSGGSANGTYLGIGAGTNTADFLNFQIGGSPSTVFKVANSGAVTTLSSAQFGGNVSNTTGTISAANGFLYNNSANTAGFVLRSNGTAYVGAALQGSDAAGVFIRNTPATTADNTIMPTASGIVSLTVKGANVASASNVLEVYNSGAVQNLQAYFDTTGSLYLNQRLNASSAVDVGTSGARFGTGYFTSSSTTTGLDVSGTVLSVNQLQFANTGNVNITVAQTTGTNVGRNVSITAGTGGSGGAVGGNLALTGGTGGASGQNGGNTTIDGGASGGGAGTKGAVIVQGTGGNVAIGTNTVTSTNTVEIASVPNNAAGGNALKVGSTLTDGSDNANTFNGIQGGITAGGSGVNYTGSLFGGNFSAVFASGTASKAASAVYGLQGGVTHNSSQATDSITNAYGGNFTVTNSNVGTIGTAYGVNAGVIKSGTGAITSAYGVYAKLQNTNASGVITTGYGVYVDVPVTTGAISTFYSAIFRGGNVGIGITTPAGLLSVGTGAGTNGAFQVDNNGNLIVGQTVTGNADVTVQAGGATNNLSLKATGTATALLDTTGAGTVTVGATATSIGIGSSGVARSISIGNSTGNTGLNLSAGTNGLVATSTGSISLTAAASATASLDVGAAGTINIGTTNNSKTIQIGNIANAVAQTIGIGNNTAGGTTTTTIGGTGSGSTMVLQGVNTKTTYDSLGLSNKATTDTSTAFNVQNSVGAMLFTVDTTNSSTGTNLAQNSGAEAAGIPSTTNNWSSYGTATVSQTTTAGEFLSGTAAAKAVTTAVNSGMKNNLGAALTVSTQYNISFSVKGSVSAGDLAVSYLPAGSTVDGSAVGTCTTTMSVSSTAFTKINCYIIPGTSGSSAAALAIYETTTGRTFYVDNMSIVAQNTTGALNAPQLRVGGVSGQGLTLLTLDSFAGRPNTNSTINSALYGSMYYDTTLGKMQCYESAGWGYCGANPDVAVNLVPEFTGGVLNGTGIGTLNSDLCANTGALTGGSAINSSLCSSGQMFNYYTWTSIQPTTQSYSIYIRYQLPATYASISSTSPITLTSRSTDVTTPGTGSGLPNGVRFSMFDAGGTQCGSTQTLASANAWTQLQISTASLSSCTLGANSIVLFKIDVSATSGSSAYVSNLSFLVKGQ